MTSYAMEDEISNLIIICFQITASLCYCYVVGKIIPKGFPTLLAILPILFFFLALPLYVRAVHLVGFISFIISWLANSKLILFAFNKGPLSDPSFSIKQFIIVASFPIIINSPNKASLCHKPLQNYIIKALVLISLVIFYSNSNSYIPSKIHYFLYVVYIYLSLEIILSILSILVRSLIGIQPGPHFNDPYLSSSLQDFWGRRWNLVAKNILQLTVFGPTQQVAMRVLGPKVAALLAVFVTFVASGLIHELIFFYLGQRRPTWNVMLFFVIHGLCLVVELCCKKILGLRLPKLVSGPLTLGFLMVTAYWLFLPQLIRCVGEQKVLEEFQAMSTFLKNATHIVTFWYNGVASA